MYIYVSIGRCLLCHEKKNEYHSRLTNKATKTKEDSKNEHRQSIRGKDRERIRSEGNEKGRRSCKRRFGHKITIKKDIPRDILFAYFITYSSLPKSTSTVVPSENVVLWRR